MTQEQEPGRVGPDDIQIDNWIDALRGVGREMSASPAARAGLIVRELVLQAQRERAESDAAYTQRLVDGWRCSGLLDGTRRRSLPERLLAAIRESFADRAAWLGASGAVLACVLLVTVMVLRKEPKDPSGQDTDAGINRGAEVASQVLVDNVGDFADQVSEVLHRGSLAFRRMDLPSGGVQLQAKVPSDAHITRRDLATIGIDVPDSGRLNLVISKRR